MIVKCLIILIAITYLSTAEAQEIETYMLLDGADSLQAFDIDTTGHWWALTRPYTDRYRLYIDNFVSDPSENFTYPIFAPGGNRWAFFQIDNNNISLIESIDEQQYKTELNATDFGEIVFSANGQQMAYSYFQGDNEILNIPTQTDEQYRQINVINKKDNCFIDNNATSYAFVGQRINQYVININGRESTTYDSIIPIGFWHDADFIYAGYNGTNWRIIKGNKTIGETYQIIKEAKINPNGTTLVVLVRQYTGRSMCIVYNDDYDLIYGKTYDNVWGLALHPTEMLYGYGAVEHNRPYIVQNNAEYYTTGETEQPFYSWNGEELIFISSGEFGPYINVNGKRYNLKIGLYTDDIIAKKPKSNTLAIATEITLLVYDFVNDIRITGYMVDETSKAIYNYRTNSYETLGVIGSRLYLMQYQTGKE